MFTVVYGVVGSPVTQRPLPERDRQRVGRVGHRHRAVDVVAGRELYVQVVRRREIGPHDGDVGDIRWGVRPRAGGDRGSRPPEDGAVYDDDDAQPDEVGVHEPHIWDEDSIFHHGPRDGAVASGSSSAVSRDGVQREAIAIVGARVDGRVSTDHPGGFIDDGP